MPSIRRHFKEERKEGLENGMLEALPSADWADGWWAIAIAIVLILIVFVLLPLLGVALELIALIFVLCSGLVGRLFFGRPWVVEAVPRGGSGQAVHFPIEGWRRSGEAAVELAQVIAATGRPEDFQIPEFR